MIDLDNVSNVRDHIFISQLSRNADVTVIANSYISFFFFFFFFFYENWCRNDWTSLIKPIANYCFRKSFQTCRLCGR
jgi:hypothetical protein